MTWEMLFKHHITILNRVFEHPERYNQTEITNAILNAKDFFCQNPEISEVQRNWFSNFQWHELFSSGYSEFMEKAEKTRLEYRERSL